MGIATAGMGALQAVGSHQQQQAQANAANRSAINNYKYQLKVREQNWNRARSNWENDKINFAETVADNDFASMQGYADAQLQLNEQFKQAAFEEQGALIKLLESTGEMAASGKTGQSAQRVDNSLMAAFGRNKATRTASLVSAKQGYQQTVDEIQRQARDENEMAFDEVAFAPMPDMAPQRPEMQEGPSGLSLALGLAGAGLSGFGKYNSLKAPKGFMDPTPKPNTQSMKIATQPVSLPNYNYSPSTWSLGGYYN